MEHMGTRPYALKKGGSSLEEGKWIRSADIIDRQMGEYGRMVPSVHLHHDGSRWEVVIASIFFGGRVHIGPAWKNSRGIDADLRKAIAQAVENAEHQFRWRGDARDNWYPDWDKRFTVDEIWKVLKLPDLNE